MARISKTEFISDIELRLNQGAISDDSELERDQIAAWATEELNGLVVQECEQALKQGKQIPPIYIRREAVTDFTQEDDQVYVTLTGQVLDIKDDNGIVQVLVKDDESTPDETEEVFKANLACLPMLKNMRYSKPSSELLVWSRRGNDLFIEGLSETDIEFYTTVVFYVKQQNVGALADSEYLYISDLFLPVLKDRVTDVAKRQMYGSTPDTTNDGTDVKAPAYHRTIQNAPPQQQPTE